MCSTLLALRTGCWPVVLTRPLPPPSQRSPSVDVLEFRSHTPKLHKVERRNAFVLPLRIREHSFWFSEKWLLAVRSSSEPGVLWRQVNTFVIHTVRLLNNFAVTCEDKLADVHRRILRVDATLSLLEAKLRSVDGLEGTGERGSPDTLPATDNRPEALVTPDSCEPEPTASSPLTQASAKTDLSGQDLSALMSQDQSQLLKVKDDPKYTRFLRMLQVGVPLQAVKMQMSLENLDSSVLDNLDGPAPT